MITKVSNYAPTHLLNDLRHRRLKEALCNDVRCRHYAAPGVLQHEAN